MTEWKRKSTIGQEEHDAVNRVISSGKLSGFIAGHPDNRDIPNGGEEVQQLEKLWALTHGSRFAISFNSATTALMAASVVARCLVHKNKVITSPFTMSASAAASRFLGMDIIFADIDYDDFNISPDSCEKYMQDGVAAIVAPSIFGHPAKLKELSDLCDSLGILLIEDCAQTPFAFSLGRIAGTVGDIGVFSLNRHKHVHCGEGGIAVTDDEEIARMLRAIRNHGVDPVGLNLRMTELDAAVGVAQTRKLPDILKHVQTMGKALTEACRNIEGVAVPETRTLCTHNYYLWTARVQHDISPGFPHIKGYIQPLYNYFGLQDESYFPETKRAREEVICFECCKWDNPIDEIVDATVEALTP